ncbi:hypothetical protein DZE40_002494 [Clostridium beijerinckii]|nr:hypothetical protein [Clostridium beijerinckii]
MEWAKILGFYRGIPINKSALKALEDNNLLEKNLAIPIFSK